MLLSILQDAVTLPLLLLCIGTAAALGFITSLVFRFRSSMSQSFCLSMVLLPAAVSVVILLVNGNLGAGIAVAGAFSMMRFRSMQGTAREICALFIVLVYGMACGMGYLAVAAVLCALVCLLVLLLTLTHACDRPSSSRILKITLPEHLDYNTALNAVFERHHVKASLQSVRTNNMGTLFETTWDLTLPSGTVPKELIDDLRVCNSNLAVIITAPGDRDAL